MRYHTILFLFLCICLHLPLPAIAGQDAIDFSAQNFCPSLQTSLQTNHQGGYEFDRARIYLSGRELKIIIYPRLPAHWLGVKIDTLNGSFEAIPYGKPMRTGPVSFEVQEQKLALQTQRFRSGEILNGTLDLSFIQKNADGTPENYNVSGCFSGVIRPEGFDPLQPENIRNLGAADMEIALYEYGPPVHEQNFTPNTAGHTRSMLLRQATKDPTKIIRELTWNVTPGAELTDSSDERLTVWYSEVGGRWRSIFYKTWNLTTSPLPPEID